MTISNILKFVFISFLLNACGNSSNFESRKSEENKFDTLVVRTVELYESGKWEEFIGQAETLIKESKKDYGLYLSLSQANSMLNNYEQAFNYAEMALEKNPDDYFARLLLGNYSLAFKEYEAAEHFYLSALAINPNYARAYVNLAQVYMQQNKNNLAIENLKKATILFSENDFKDEVISYSKEILKLDPDNQFAKENIKENSKSQE